MRVTVIPVDKTIIVDSNPLVLEKWDFEDSHINAIQWYHDYGIIEYKHINLEEPRPDNERVDDQTIITKYTDVYFSEIPKLKSKKIKQEEEERLRKIQEELELKKYEEEQEKNRREVQNQIEINKKLREEKLRIQQEKDDEIARLEEEARLAKLEARQKEVEKQEIAFQQQMEEREKYWNEHFKKENEKLQEIHKKLSEQIENSEKEFEKQLEIVKRAREIEYQRLEKDKEEIKKTKELIGKDYGNRLQSLEAEENRIKLLNEEIEQKRIQNEKEIEVEMKKLQELQKEVQLQRKISVDEIQLAIDRYEKEKQLLESGKKALEDEAKIRELQLQIEIERSNKQLENIKLETAIAKKEREEIEKGLEEKIRNLEYSIIEDRKNDAKLHTLSELEQIEIRKLAREKAEEKIREIDDGLANADVLKLISMVGPEEIENIDVPVQRAIELLQFINRAKDLSIKYNVSIIEAFNFLKDEGYSATGEDLA